MAALGLHSAGGVLVPLNTRYKGREAAYILGKAQVRALVTITGFLDVDYVGLLRDAVDVPTELPELETCIVLRGDAPAGTVGWHDFVAAGAIISDDDAEARALAVEPTDLSDIVFTSGTTGNPKGVMQTHATSLRAFRDWSDIVGLRDGDRYLVVNPFFHTFGYKAGWLASLMMGATVLPQAVFDVAAVLERIPRDRVSVLPGPPTLYQSILNHPERDRYDLSRLRLAVTGAAAIPVELILRMRDELTFEHDHHGLRAHRGVRHRDHVPLRRRSRDDRDDLGPRDSRRRGARRRRGAVGRCRVGSRARSWCGATT